MSTKQFQAYDDANTALEIASERMKAARKEFVAHIRRTGTDLRKQFVPDSGRTTIGSIVTSIGGGFARNGNFIPASMSVVIHPYSVDYDINANEMQDIRYYLQSKGWAIQSFYDQGTTSHIIYCI